MGFESFPTYLEELAKRMQRQEPEGFREFGGLFGPLLAEAYREAGLETAAAERRAVSALRNIAVKIAEGEIANSKVFGEQLRAALSDVRGYSQRDEIAHAAAVQKRLSKIGLTMMAGLEIQLATQPARVLNGDLHDVLDLGGGRVLVVLGDGVGKGAAAAIYATLTLGAIRSKAAACPSPVELLQYLNGLLAPHTESRDSVALCALLWDAEMLTLTIANAGMPQPVLVRGNEFEEVVATGRPLGWFADSEYEGLRVQLRPGELLVVHSDGLSDDPGWIESFHRLVVAQSIRAGRDSAGAAGGCQRASGRSDDRVVKGGGLPNSSSLRCKTDIELKFPALWNVVSD